MTKTLRSQCRGSGSTLDQGARPTYRQSSHVATKRSCVMCTQDPEQPNKFKKRSHSSFSILFIFIILPCSIVLALPLLEFSSSCTGIYFLPPAVRGAVYHLLVLASASPHALSRALLRTLTCSGFLLFFTHSCCDS